jgi:hypothetical protein
MDNFHLQNKSIPDMFSCSVFEKDFQWQAVYIKKMSEATCGYCSSSKQEQEHSISLETPEFRH